MERVETGMFQILSHFVDPDWNEMKNEIEKKSFFKITNQICFFKKL